MGPDEKGIQDFLSHQPYVLNSPQGKMIFEVRKDDASADLVILIFRYLDEYMVNEWIIHLGSYSPDANVLVVTNKGDRDASEPWMFDYISIDASKPAHCYDVLAQFIGDHKEKMD